MRNEQVRVELTEVDGNNVAAGGAHDLNVKCDFSGAKSGEQVEVHFEGALPVADKPVPVDPVVLKVQ
ncbi:MAG TPA: hypothetical protein VGJ84_09545 [Polyangiaceae bacterium]